MMICLLGGSCLLLLLLRTRHRVELQRVVRYKLVRLSGIVIIAAGPVASCRLAAVVIVVVIWCTRTVVVVAIVGIVLGVQSRIKLGTALQIGGRLTNGIRIE